MSGQYLRLAPICLLAFYGSAVLAEEGVIEEIMVTAQKRSQSVQDVPIAMTALGGEALREYGALDVKDILTRTPGLAGASKDGFIDTLSIRGISTNDYGVGGDLSVALFQNGVHSGRSGEALSGFYDIERVEVLRGPQGLLFGRSATSGAIHVVTSKPEQGDQVTGEIGFGAGERGLLRGDFMVNAPVNDSLALRFAGYHSEEDGYAENLSGGDDLVSHNKDGLRGSLAWSGKRTSVDLVIDYERRDQSPTIYSMLDSAGNPVTGDHLDVDTELLDRGYDETDVFNLSLKVERELASSTLVAITGFRSYEFDYREDFDGSSTPLFDYIQDQEGGYFSQEVRLVSSSENNLQWFVGVSYFIECIS